MSKRYPHQILLTIVFLLITLFQASLFAEETQSISQNILNEVLSNREVSHFLIEVSDSPYSVSIRGEVATDKQKQIILDVAKKFAGTREIEDQVTIAKDKFGTSYTSDPELQNSIQSALVNEGISGAIFDVKEGVVTIKGNFRSFKDVDYLFSIIQSIPGVKRIDSNATVNSKPYMQEFKGRGSDFNERRK